MNPDLIHPNENSSSSEPGRLAIGTVVDGKYEVTSYLGSGGMGAVYRARHVELEIDVALKVLHPRFAADEESLQRFQLEARTIARLRHKNILSVYSFGSVGGLQYMAMEFLQGQSLSSLIYERSEAGYLTPAEGVPLLLQVCEGMIYAHNNAVLHRDLKPDNTIIVREPDGSAEVKLVDFGLAKLVDGDQMQRLTQTGEVVGDPNYMSPEQCQGRPLDNRSDIYSFGCMMYEMFSGERPFNGDSPMAILFAQVSDEPKPFAAAKNQPAALEGITLTAMAKSAADRYESFEALHAVLENFLSHPDMKITAPISKIKKSGALKPHSFWMYAVATSVLLIGGSAWLLSVHTEKMKKEAAAIAREEQLIELQRQWRVNKRTKSIEDITQLLDLAQQNGNKTAEALARIELADYYYDMGDLAKSREIANKALSMPELPYTYRPRVLNYAAFSSYGLRLYPEAERRFEEIYRSLRPQRFSSSGQGSIAHNLADVKLKIGKLDEAQEIIEGLDMQPLERESRLNPNRLLRLDFLLAKKQFDNAEALLQDILAQPIGVDEKTNVLAHACIGFADGGNQKRATELNGEMTPLADSSARGRRTFNDRARVVELYIKSKTEDPAVIAPQAEAAFNAMESKSKDIFFKELASDVYSQALRKMSKTSEADAAEERMKQSIRTARIASKAESFKKRSH